MKNISLFKIIAAFLVLSFALTSNNLLAAETQANKTATARTQVVFQVSDDDARKWNLTLNNVKNIQQELGASNVDIEVVAYGPGINMLKFESTVSERVDEALKAGVKIVACENTMKSLKLSKADMMSTIGYVPAGVVEIIRKQKEGYAYIRP
jgi:intracellular sulfur oxidation DsrE/DsrF family protein